MKIRYLYLGKSNYMYRDIYIFRRENENAYHKNRNYAKKISLPFLPVQQYTNTYV